VRRKLAVHLLWHGFSEYYSRQLTAAIRGSYDTLVTYRKDVDCGEFDAVYCFFPYLGRVPACGPGKLVKSVWERGEYGHAKDAGVVLAHSTQTYERVAAQRRYAGRARYLPWGVNPEHFEPQPFPLGERVVGWAGTPANGRKRFEELEAAMKEAGAIFKPNLCTTRRGRVTGPYASTQDMPWYYRQVHVYACASKSEGFGFPLLEAAACGRAVVTFDVGCARDLMETGAGVVIVEDFDEMKEAVMGIDHEELGRRSARAVREHWAWDAVAPRWLEVLEEVGA
jgi:glycosyltransferase involved in cell wall biosynthesis